MAPPRSGHLPAAGVLAVPPWRPGLEASVLPEAYRDLLEVAEDAGRPLRAGQIDASFNIDAVSKTYQECNYLQSMEGGLDTSHSMSSV